MNTNHVSSDLDELKRLVSSEGFSGFKARIVDDTGAVVFEPPARERSGDLSVEDIAGVLGVPVVSPDEFSKSLNELEEEP